MSVCLSVRFSVCLFVCLSVCLFVCLSICLFVCLSVCLFVCFLLLSVHSWRAAGRHQLVEGEWVMNKGHGWMRGCAVHSVQWRWKTELGDWMLHFSNNMHLWAVLLHIWTMEQLQGSCNRAKKYLLSVGFPQTSNLAKPNPTPSIALFVRSFRNHILITAKPNITIKCVLMMGTHLLFSTWTLKI